MIRFGVIGAGNIANTFSEAVKNGNLDAELYAIASRSMSKAKSYQETYQYKVAYDSYLKLYQDPNVDAIYIATPHGLHYEQMLQILDHKKHILCEKSFTLNEHQAREVFAKAKDKGVFVMEAVWTRFLPTIRELQAIVQEGMIGQVKEVQADFCFQTDKDDQDRLFNPDLGGGALLDVGIYPITFANLFMGKPQSISSTMTKHKTGVDASEEIFFTYPNGKAILQASLVDNKPLKGTIKGTKGSIDVNNFFYTEHATVYNLEDQIIKELSYPHKVNGFEYEIEETIACIKKGLSESPIMPHSETLSILKQMDALRKAWGFTYPKEKEEN
jgi:predicted dehydrogenase